MLQAEALNSVFKLYSLIVTLVPSGVTALRRPLQFWRDLPLEGGSWLRLWEVESVKSVVLERDFDLVHRHFIRLSLQPSTQIVRRKPSGSF